MKARNYISIIATLLFAASVTACNTVDGVGKDVESVGKKVEESVD